MSSFGQVCSVGWSITVAVGIGVWPIREFCAEVVDRFQRTAIAHYSLPLPIGAEGTPNS